MRRAIHGTDRGADRSHAQLLRVYHASETPGQPLRFRRIS